MLIRTAGLPLAHLKGLSVSWQTAEEAILVGQKCRSDEAIVLQKSWDAALRALDDPALRTAIYNARKAFFQHQKLPAAATLRQISNHADLPEISTLLRSIEAYSDAENQLHAAHAAYRQQYEQALRAGYQCLQHIAGMENFQRALLFASHSLIDQLPRFCKTPVDEFVKKERQTALAVLKYATRMATKTSPLSRFTTVSLHKMAPEPIENPGTEPFSLAKSL